MLSFLNPLRCCTLLSVVLRLLLALVCGGIIGLEREFKRRPAGFRTHILICVGAALTIITGQYLVQELELNTDIARIGAQVVAGVGFIGAGTIVATKQGRVRGLTTAAGLWSAAIVGLACGAGFFEGAVCVTALVLLTELLFLRLEAKMLARHRELNLCVSYDNAEALRDMLDYLHTKKLRVTDMELGKNVDRESTYVLISLRVGRAIQAERILSDLRAIAGMRSVEAL